MNSSDSFELLFNQIIQDINTVIEKLAVIGLAYLSKLLIKTILDGFSTTKSYIVPLVVSNDKWVKSLGNWAIVTGKRFKKKF